MSYLDLARQVLTIEIDAIQDVSDRLGQSFTDSVNATLDVLNNQGKIVVVGVGKSGNIGHKIAATFNSTGATAVVLNAQNALHGDLGIVSDGDIILAMSYSGETDELLQILPHLRRFDVQMIALTGKPESTLSQNANFTINTAVEKEACPLNLAPTSSSTAMLALGDALAMVLLEARGFNAEDFAKFHPGGSLGRALLTTVDDIMRAQDEMVIITPDTTVNEALLKMSQKKAGACVIVKNLEVTTALGIFTHGDFVRAFQNNANLGELAVEGFMTSNPIHIQSGALAAQALQILKQHRIDDILVLDSESRPLGIIDSQDLAKHKIL